MKQGQTRPSGGNPATGRTGRRATARGRTGDTTDRADANSGGRGAAAWLDPCPMLSSKAHKRGRTMRQRDRPGKQSDAGLQRAVRQSPACIGFVGECSLFWAALLCCYTRATADFLFFRRQFSTNHSIFGRTPVRLPRFNKNLVTWQRGRDHRTAQAFGRSLMRSIMPLAAVKGLRPNLLDERTVMQGRSVPAFRQLYSQSPECHQCEHGALPQG